MSLPSLTAPPSGLTRASAPTGVIRLVAHGEIDLAVRAGAGAHLAQAQAEAATVLLDLREASFLDSTGLHLALDASARARRAGTRFALIAGPEHVHRVFALTGVERRLEWTRAGRGG